VPVWNEVGQKCQASEAARSRNSGLMVQAGASTFNRNDDCSESKRPWPLYHLKSPNLFGQSMAHPAAAGTNADTARPEIPNIVQHLNIFHISNRRDTCNNLVTSNLTSPQRVYA